MAGVDREAPMSGRYRPVSGKAVVHPRREERRKRAEARKDDCAQLTPQQRLRWLNEQGYTAARERARLLNQLKAKP